MSAATSHAHDHDASPGSKTLALKPFSGGGRWVFAGGGLGLVFLILTFIGMAMNPKDAGFSYLMAFTYWGGISFTSVILLMIFHATHARWVTVLRRPDRGDVGLGGDLPVSLHPAHLRDEVRLRLDRPARQPGA